MAAPPIPGLLPEQQRGEFMQASPPELPPAPTSEQGEPSTVGAPRAAGRRCILLTSVTSKTIGFRAGKRAFGLGATNGARDARPFVWPPHGGDPPASARHAQGAPASV